VINGLATPTFAVASKAAERSQAAAEAAEPAKEFEAVMLSILLSNMRKSSFGEGLFPGDKSDTMGGLFDMMVSGQLADTGGLGLQQLVTEWLAEQQGQSIENLNSELINASTTL